MSEQGSDVDVLIKGLERIREDLRLNPDAWQNRTLEDYLESTQAWLESTKSRAPKEPSWEFVVGVFGVGKIYE